MLSRWRKQAREGKIVTKGVEVDKDVAAELKALRKVKRDYERLKIEHDLLKKAIEFTSKRKQTSSPSSSTAKRSTDPTDVPAVRGECERLTTPGASVQPASEPKPMRCC